MKMLHIQFVPKCKNEDDCKFYSTKKCWFVHLEDIEIAYSNAKNGSQSRNILDDMEWKMKLLQSKYWQKSIEIKILNDKWSSKIYQKPDLWS